MQPSTQHDISSSNFFMSLKGSLKHFSLSLYRLTSLALGLCCSFYLKKMASAMDYMLYVFTLFIPFCNFKSVQLVSSFLFFPFSLWQPLAVFISSNNCSCGKVLYAASYVMAEQCYTRRLIICTIIMMMHYYHYYCCC